jgi:hypothetical protein
MVAAEQLKAAHGNVRCGTCLQSFDAIPHLSDGPVPAAAAHASDAGGEALAAEEATGRDSGGGRSASARLSSTLDAARAAASPGSAAAASAAAVASGGGHGEDPYADFDVDDDHDDESDDEDYDEHEDGEAPLAAGGPPAPRRVALLDEPDEQRGAPLPSVLRQDAEDFAAERAARRRAVAYAAAALALVLLLATQYVFFMPEDAARRYPLFRGAIESVCVRVGCVLPERRDPSRIRVLSRDVRVHPRYEGVMQIKATLANGAPFRQPYPRVRFTLFNVNGQTIATRVFQPSEYLGRPVDASARLRPKAPFQVELDVLAPGEAAVSFEFQFL